MHFKGSYYTHSCCDGSGVYKMTRIENSQLKFFLQLKFCSMGFCIYAKQRNILKESSSMEPIVKHKNNINFKNIQSHHNYFSRLS